MFGNSPKYEPSPKEIAAETARIREGWSDAEHYLRAGLRVPQYVADDVYQQSPYWSVAYWQPPECNSVDDGNVRE